MLNPIDLEGQIRRPQQHNVASGLFQNDKEKNVIISVMVKNKKINYTFSDTPDKNMTKTY